MKSIVVNKLKEARFRLWAFHIASQSSFILPRILSFIFLVILLANVFVFSPAALFFISVFLCAVFFVSLAFTLFKL